MYPEDVERVLIMLQGMVERIDGHVRLLTAVVFLLTGVVATQCYVIALLWRALLASGVRVAW